MASPFSRPTHQPDPATRTDTAWHLGDWLRSHFEGARSFMSERMHGMMPGDSAMPMHRGMPMHDAHARTMDRIMALYEERVRAAEDRLDPDQAHQVVMRLDALVDLMVSSIQDTPDHLLAKMLDHSMMQDYERRFDEVMRLPHPSDGDHH